MSFLLTRKVQINTFFWTTPNSQPCLLTIIFLRRFSNVKSQLVLIHPSSNIINIINLPSYNTKHNTPGRRSLPWTRRWRTISNNSTFSPRSLTRWPRGRSVWPPSGVSSGRGRKSTSPSTSSWLGRDPAWGWTRTARRPPRSGRERTGPGRRKRMFQSRRVWKLYSYQSRNQICREQYNFFAIVYSHY